MRKTQERVGGHRIEHSANGRHVVGARRDERDHPGVCQHRVAQALAHTPQRLGCGDQSEPKLAAFVDDAAEGFGIEGRYLVDDEEVLPALMLRCSLSPCRIHVEATDAHRPEQPGVVASDLRAVDHEKVAPIHDLTWPDSGFTLADNITDRVVADKGAEFVEDGLNRIVVLPPTWGWPFCRPEGCEQRVVELGCVGRSEGVVGKDPDQLEDRLRFGSGQEREQRMAQVVLHLGPGEVRPEIVDEPHEFRGDQLSLVGCGSLQEVEGPRVGTVGEAKDMDLIGMACRHAFEDVGREIAVWIDDGGARVMVQDSKSQLGDERALARSGRTHNSHMARDGREWHLQRSTARLADDHAGRHDKSPRRRRCGEGSLARQPGLIEVRIWQIPEAREFEVRERNARRAADRTGTQIPRNRLRPSIQRRSRVDGRPQDRLCLSRIDAGDFEQ